MNRRSFLSSLAALSLPAVVAGKVAEIAGYGCDCGYCTSDGPTALRQCVGPLKHPRLSPELVECINSLYDATDQMPGFAALFPSCTVTPIG